MTATFRVHCQIIKSGDYLVDQVRQIQADYEAQFTATGFTTKVTIQGLSAGTISLIANLQCGLRYISPELTISDGDSEEIEFESHVVRLGVSTVEG
jgi:hypothetical protein